MRKHWLFHTACWCVCGACVWRPLEDGCSFAQMGKIDRVGWTWPPQWRRLGILSVGWACCLAQPSIRRLVRMMVC